MCDMLKSISVQCHLYCCFRLSFNLFTFSDKSNNERLPECQALISYIISYANSTDFSSWLTDPLIMWSIRASVFNKGWLAHGNLSAVMHGVDVLLIFCIISL